MRLSLTLLFASTMGCGLTLDFDPPEVDGGRRDASRPDTSRADTERADSMGNADARDRRDVSGDTHRVVTDCMSALEAMVPDGTPCDFVATCSLGRCLPKLSCEGGALFRRDDACTWTRCEDFVEMGGDVGDECGGMFDTCRTETMDCCHFEYACEGRRVTARTLCDPECELPVCPDYGGLGTVCTTSAACRPDESCVPTHVPPGCGTCLPVEGCLDDEGCSLGQVCVPSGPCSCDPKHCVSACAADAECPDTFTCQTGRCEPIPCDDPSYDCPMNFRCDPASRDNHGCQRLECEISADCDCGSCLGTTCSSGPARCRPIAL